MNKSILLISTQYPSYGGAATLVYRLHHTLIERGVDSHCIFLNTRNIKKELYNPSNLSNVYHQLLIGDYNDNKITSFYNEIVKLNLKPNIVIGFNYIAPIIGKKIFPNTIVCYYITGCKYLSDVDISAYHYLNGTTRYNSEQNEDELYCMNVVDLIIPNSYLTKNVLNKIYPSISHKLTDVITFEELFFNINQLLNLDKPYDIAVVSSRFDRGVKNINFIKHLFNDSRLEKYNKICIGKCSENIINANHHFGFVDSNRVDDILSKTKIVLICSRFESLSITLIQALNNKCIVLSNQNIGGSIYLDKFYILHHFCTDTWINKITNIVDNYSYHSKIFKPLFYGFDPIEKIDKLINIKIDDRKFNVVFVTVDKPYEGGSSNNLLNIIKIFRQKSKSIRPIGLFIVNNLNDINVEEYKRDHLYFVVLDKNIEENLDNVINEIETNIGDISLYFIKNYKAVTCFLRKIEPSKIIFSPSGLRMVSSLQNYYNKLSNDDLIKHRIQAIEFNQDMGLFDFIKKYDTNLELYVFERLKYIVPNSLLTYNLIQTIYQLDYKLLPYINLTYIDYDGATVECSNFNNRKYDIGFISFNWKRNVKNFDFINRLIEKMNTEMNRKLNILIVGDNQKLKTPCNNITSFKHVEHDKLLDLFKEIKIICMNSYYDSSPNILKEAVQEGCQVLITENIGNSNYFNEVNFISEPDHLEQWINKIGYLLDNKPVYPLKNNIDSTQIFYTLENLILSKINEKEFKLIECSDNVGFHKLPSDWTGLSVETTDDRLVIETKCHEIYKTLNEYDLFFEYFTHQFDGYHINSNNKYHFCIVDNNNDNNDKITYFRGVNYLPYIRDNVYLWRISKDCHINRFKNCNKYFFRGNYYKLFNDIAPLKYKTLYCATALFYDKTFNIVTNSTIPYKFDNLLVEEDNLEKVTTKFPASNVVKYLKKVTSNFISYNLSRDIDYLFVATEKQFTKNRKLFVDFVVYCETNNVKTTICNIGKHDDYYNEKLKGLKYVNYIQFDSLSSSQLVDIYNRSRINLIFSGRDALPRVVIESLGCGCYNIALDTLTDGKFLYREPMGKILSFPNLEREYNVKTKSISYVSNNEIFSKLVKCRKLNYKHDKISMFYYNIVNNYNINTYNINIMEKILVISELVDYVAACKTHYSLTKGFDFSKGLVNNNKQVYYVTTGKSCQCENVNLINIDEIDNQFVQTVNYVILIRETNITEIMNKSYILKELFHNKSNKIKIAIKCDNIDWLLSKEYIKYFENNTKWINFAINCFDMICCQTDELKKAGLFRISSIYDKELCEQIEKRIFISRMGVRNEYPVDCETPYDVNHQYCVNNFTTLRQDKALHPLYFIDPYLSYSNRKIDQYNKKKHIIVYTGRIKTNGVMYMMRDIMKQLGDDFELHIFPGRFSIPNFEVSVISPKCPVNLQLLRDIVFYDCSNVIIHMPYDDKNKAKYLLNADIAIDFSPSRPKNQKSVPGNAKLLEYCYFGLKVVCERNINNSHIPIGAKNSIIIDNIGTVEEYVDAIREISKRTIDKKYAIQYTIENHNWDIISRDLIDNLNTVY